ncbi:MAG: hypothetical protein CSA79_00795 [Thiothrix nivea]|nr:MAG: hypothetical protein CSA79_00795 [Thiothrix nivea]
MVSTLVTVPINPCYWWWAVKAQRARSNGVYQRQTLRYFFRAWKLSGDINDLLAYILFRRDLGYTLSNCWAVYLERKIQHLKPARQLLVAALLFEARGKCPDHFFPLLTAIDQCQSPVVLSCLSRNGAELSTLQARLGQIHNQQQDWRKAFQAGLLKQAHRGGICVVGNAGNMKGALLGETIDQHDCVARFNTFSSPKTDEKDMGYKHDIWVITPGFQVTVLPKDFSGTVILTGPDVRYQLLNWSGVSAVVKRELTLLTTPLPVWQNLVRELTAPPSAGILFLAWLKVLLGSWSGVSVAGFSALNDVKKAYHHTDAKHKPSARHNWLAEAALLRRWQQEGLTSLHG